MPAYHNTAASCKPADPYVQHRIARRKAERYNHKHAILEGQSYVQGKCLLGEKLGNPDRLPPPSYPIQLRALERFMWFDHGGPCRGPVALKFIDVASRFLARHARETGQPYGWLRRWASHHTPELCEQWSELDFARKEFEAGKRRKGRGVTPDDMAQIFDIREYRLEECFGLNRRKRGGLVSVERPKAVREAERKTDWYRKAEAERKRNARRANGAPSFEERTAQARADREQAAREGVTPAAIRQRRSRQQRKGNPEQPPPASQPRPQTHLKLALAQAPVRNRMKPFRHRTTGL